LLLTIYLQTAQYHVGFCEDEKWVFSKGCVIIYFIWRDAVNRSKHISDIVRSCVVFYNTHKVWREREC